MFSLVSSKKHLFSIRRLIVIVFCLCNGEGFQFGFQFGCVRIDLEKVIDG